MSRCHLLLNRGAGGSDRGIDPEEVRRLVEAAFGAAGRAISTTIAEPRNLVAALRRIAAERPDILIVGGGDGTVATAAKELGGTGVALGVLPMGTFNLAARDLGVPLDVGEAARFLAKAEPVEIDVLDVNGAACLCTTVLGFYPEFSETFERRDHGGRWWRKALRLLTGLPEHFRRARPLGLRWSAGSRQGRVRSKFAAFVPGRYRESGGVVPAREGLRTGKLTAYLGSQLDPADALRAVADFVSGRHESNPDLHIVEAASMEIRIGRKRRCKAMIDGEILRLRTPLRLKILPRHLKVLAAAETEP